MAVMVTKSMAMAQPADNNANGDEVHTAAAAKKQQEEEEEEEEEEQEEQEQEREDERQSERLQPPAQSNSSSSSSSSNRVSTPKAQQRALTATTVGPEQVADEPKGVVAVWPRDMSSVMRLRLMFEQADQDADGVIGADDVRGMLRGSRKSKFQQEDGSAAKPVGSGRRWSPAVSDAEVEQLLSAMDTDGDGVVTEDEFNAWASHFWQPCLQSSRLVR
eukprot:COSAG01_NODE_1539_length_9983_cov_211.998381_6_plen_218_part_00